MLRIARFAMRTTASGKRPSELSARHRAAKHDLKMLLEVINLRAGSIEKDGVELE
jgi:hypothetical protein